MNEQQFLPEYTTIYTVHAAWPVSEHKAKTISNSILYGSSRREPT
jgi:hypothetical protein